MKTENWNAEPIEIQAQLKCLVKGTFIRNGQLYKKISGRKLLYINPSERVNLILDVHHYLGHAGIRKTYEYLMHTYY